MDFSRGKRMVELSLKNKILNTETQNEPSINNESAFATTNSSEIYTFRPLQDVGNTLNLDKDDIYSEKVERAEEDFFNFDDTVNDPDFIPEDGGHVSSDSEREILVEEHEEQVETVNNNTKRTPGEKWKKNENKRLRKEGKKYKGMGKADDKWGYIMERKERVLTPRQCSKRCARPGVKKCSLISDTDRNNIFTMFWNDMDWEQRKVYVNSLIGSTDVNVRTTDENSRRNRSLKYYLRKGEDRICVCKSLFLSTLGIGEKTVYTWTHAASHGIPKKLSSSDERRAAQAERHAQKRESVRNFLDELPKMESHYCRASTTKLYLEPVFPSFQSVYDEYKRQYQGSDVAGIKLFSEQFSLMNVGLFSPKKDQCDVCCGFEVGSISAEAFNAHQTKKTQARAEKDADKASATDSNSVRVVTMDVQSVLLSPKLNASALYYKTKLACHNFTVYDLNTKDVQCYFWHEGQGDLSGNSFASCIADYIDILVGENQEIQRIVLFSDGCGYQNRNVVLANTLCHLSTKHGICITQKFLEKGHTQMEVDSVHSVIERNVKRKNIYVPQNYVDIMRECRPGQPYVVHYVDHTFFKKYSQLNYYSSIRPGTKIGDPVVADLRVIDYTPTGDIHYKLEFSDELRELPRRARNPNPASIEPEKLHDAPLKIKKSKYDHLQALKSVVPADYHAFYDTLDHA